MTREEILASIQKGLIMVSTHAVVRSNLISSRLGINMTDLESLEVLMRHGKMSSGELGKELRLSTGAITKLVDRLETKKFVSRVFDKSDRRKIWIEVDFQMVQKKIFPLYEHMITHTTELLASYNDEELTIIHDFLMKSIKISEKDFEFLSQTPQK